MVDASGQQQHPEAEMLAAFAERTLTPFERTQILEHLGGCARCRELLFLVHEVTPEAEAASAPVVVGGRGRLLGWLPVWLPIAAAVVVVLGIGYARLHRGGRQPAVTTEMAVVATPPPPIAEALAPAIKALPKSAREFKVAPVPPPPPPPPAARALQPPPRGFGSAEGSASAALKSQLAPQQAGAGVVVQSQQVGQMNRWAASQDGASPVAIPQSAVARSAPSAPAPIANAKMAPPSMRARENATVVAVAPATPPPAAIAMSDKIVSSNTIEVQASNADLQTMNAAVGSTIDAATVANLPMALPGSKKMVSNVAVTDRTLALDASGDLYLLQKNAPWRKIHKQWKGKATTLSLAKPRNAVLLTNQHQETWQSDDGGETWQAIATPKGR